MMVHSKYLFYSVDVPQQEMSPKDRKFMLIMGIVNIAFFLLFILLF